MGKIKRIKAVLADEHLTIVDAHDMIVDIVNGDDGEKKPSVAIYIAPDVTSHEIGKAIDRMINIHTDLIISECKGSKQCLN